MVVGQWDSWDCPTGHSSHPPMNAYRSPDQSSLIRPWGRHEVWAKNTEIPNTDYWNTGIPQRCTENSEEGPNTTRHHPCHWCDSYSYSYLTLPERKTRGSSINPFSRFQPAPIQLSCNTDPSLGCHNQRRTRKTSNRILASTNCSTASIQQTPAELASLGLRSLTLWLD